ncbi:MAG: transcription antitermination factor NusB [Lachnospiraceae bacterium]
MLRTKVREEIFKIVFGISFNDKDDMSEQLGFAMEELEAKSEENRSYISNKVMGILDELDTIDQYISENCEGWNIERIGKAELAIMRIATYEMLYEDDIPHKIAINEAVELSKTYCDDSAPGFVNAVLGKIERNIQ